jgi:hypothetical protein
MSDGKISDRPIKSLRDYGQPRRLHQGKEKQKNTGPAKVGGQDLRAS